MEELSVGADDDGLDAVSAVTPNFFTLAPLQPAPEAAWIGEGTAAFALGFIVLIDQAQQIRAVAEHHRVVFYPPGPPTKPFEVIGLAPNPGTLTLEVLDPSSTAAACQRELITTEAACPANGWSTWSMCSGGCGDEACRATCFEARDSCEAPCMTTLAMCGPPWLPAEEVASVPLTLDDRVASFSIWNCWSPHGCDDAVTAHEGSVRGCAAGTFTDSEAACTARLRADAPWCGRGFLAPGCRLVHACIDEEATACVSSSADERCARECRANVDPSSCESTHDPAALCAEEVW